VIVNRVWLVARHEYLHNLRRGGFLFAAIGVPLLTVALMVIVFAITVQAETDTTRVGRVGYVDQSGVLAEAVNQPEYFERFETVEAAEAALAGEIGAYFVVTPEYMNTGRIRLISNSDTPESLEDDIDAFLLANLSTQADPDVAHRLADPANSSVLTLDNGRVIEDTAAFGVIIAPFLFVMIFLLASQTTSGYLMSGVVEEKSNRIMEILVTSITPFELLAGKIIGLGLLGLTQLAIWAVMGTIALRFGQNIEFLSAVSFPPDLLLISLIYFLLGYFFFASLMAGIGAVVGSEQESRQFASIFSLLLVIPFFAIVEFFNNPDGALVTFLTLFPLTSPVAVILRMGFGVVPTWQLIASIVLLIVTAVVVTWASARIFRWSLLMYGKRPNLRQVLSAVLRSRGMETTATGERNA
jgi:ABC-2 type transport system permease protein